MPRTVTAGGWAGTNYSRMTRQICPASFIERSAYTGVFCGMIGVELVDWLSLLVFGPLVYM